MKKLNRLDRDSYLRRMNDHPARVIRFMRWPMATFMLMFVLSLSLLLSKALAVVTIMAFAFVFHQDQVPEQFWWDTTSLTGSKKALFLVWMGNASLGAPVLAWMLMARHLGSVAQ
jgi:hypothetical protein